MKKPINRHGRVSEIPASQVKSGWHGILDRVSQAREEIVITRYGKPVARLSPVEEQREADRIIGWLEGTVTFHADVIAPTGEVWEADG